MELPIFDSSLLEGLELKPGDPPASSIRKGETRAQRTIPITRIYQVLSGKILIIYGSNIRSGSTRRHFSVAVEQGQVAAVAGGIDLEIIGDENSEILTWRDPENKYKLIGQSKTGFLEEPDLKYSPRSYGKGFVSVANQKVTKLTLTDKKVTITAKTSVLKPTTKGLSVSGGVLTALDASGNHIDEIKIIPNGLKYLNVSFNTVITIPDLSQTNLEVLICKDCGLKKLPLLPQTLKVLVVSRNNLTNLPNLPPNLEVLRCSNNPIGNLPDLPITLRHLSAKYTRINKVNIPPNLVVLDIIGRNVATTTELPDSLRSFSASFSEGKIMPELPTRLEKLVLGAHNIRLVDLPDTLKVLDLSRCQEIENIPLELPPKLEYFDIAQMGIDYLPKIPNTVVHLNVSGNILGELPDLPPKLEFLAIDGCHLSEIGKLPATLKILDASANSEITVLPELPRGLLDLDVSECSLETLPTLPPGLLRLVCHNNQLKVLMNLPETLTRLDCRNNPLEFIEPIPIRPQYIEVPENLAKFFTERNYNKYYETYTSFRKTLVYLVIVGGLRDPHLGALDLKTKWIEEMKRKFK